MSSANRGWRRGFWESAARELAAAEMSTRNAIEARCPAVMKRLLACECVVAVQGNTTAKEPRFLRRQPTETLGLTGSGDAHSGLGAVLRGRRLGGDTLVECVLDDFQAADQLGRVL